MNTLTLHSHYQLQNKGWQYLIIFLVMLNLCYTNVHAQTRIGAHVTQEELNIWRQRAASGPYKTAEDVSSNSPNDWTRIVNSKTNGFAGARYKTGSMENSTSCLGTLSQSDGPWGFSNVRAGLSSNLLNSAFYYLVCKAGVNVQSDAVTIGADVKAELLGQCRELATDASNRNRWCLQTNDSYFPNLIWVVKLAHAYDYTKDLFSLSEKREFETWLMNWALYAKESNDFFLLSNFNNRYATTNFPATLYPVSNNRDKVTQTGIEPDGDTLWKSGHEARPRVHYYGQLTSSISKAYNNRTNNFGNICAEVAHLVELSGALTKTAAFSTYTKLGVGYTSHRTVTTVGDLIDDLKLKAKMYFKEAIVYSVYEDHLSSDIRRWEADAPNNAIIYEGNAVGLLANMADLFARAGDDELMLFETTKGIDYTATTSDPWKKGTFGGIGGPKSIKKIMETHVGMYTGSVTKYGTNDPTRVVPFFILDGESGTSYVNNGVTYTGFSAQSYVSESHFLPIAKYFKNTAALNAIQRKAIANARPFPTISSSNGQHNRYAGITGFYPGQYFMFETSYNPYNTSCTATGSILREVWSNVTGETVNLIPVATTPASTNQLTSFEAPSNVADSYGQRIRGYICAPTTGNYIFYIAGDNNCELWLSTDGNPANKVKIAHITGAGAWAPVRDWDKYSTQQSVSKSLVAGKSYYVEVLHKENGNGDNLAVGWKVPGSTIINVIPGNRLSPFVSSGARLGTIAETSLEAENELHVYPNPFEDNITIAIGKGKSGVTAITLVDGLGKVYYSSTKTLSGGTDENTIQLSGKYLKPGIYFVIIIRANAKSKVIKLIKH